MLESAAKMLDKEPIIFAVASAGLLSHGVRNQLRQF